VTLLNAFPGLERMFPFALFALYMFTAVKICTYSSWVNAGSPNPFLPRRMKAAVAIYNKRQRYGM